MSIAKFFYPCITTALILSMNTACDKKPRSNSAIATVNGVSIPRSYYTREMDMVTERMSMNGQQVPQDRLDIISKRIIDQLVESELLFQESKKKGINIDQATVDSEYERMSSRFPDPAAAAEALSRMQMTPETMKQTIGRNMAIKEFLDGVVEAMPVANDDELQKYYDEHKPEFSRPEEAQASHILIKVDESAAAEDHEKAKATLQDLKKQLAAGKDFAVLAEAHSDCPSKAKGGDLGRFTRGRMVKEFETVAFAQKPGQISDVVKTQFGYHLIRTDAVKEPGQRSFAESKQEISDKLKRGKTQETIAGLVEQLKENATIELFNAS